MRERVEQGRTGFERGGERHAARGPRPVRPARALVLVRPLEVPRPVRESASGCGAVERAGAWSGRDLARPGSGPRVLVRRAVHVGESASRLWRAVAGIAVVASSAVIVVALGLIVRVTEPAPVPVQAHAPVVVTAGPGETVWDVAARIAPGRPGSEVAAVAERIVVENDLPSVRLEPGQVLRVAGG